MDALISPSEYQLIPFKSLLEKSSEPLSVLPFQGSSYVNEGIKAALSTSKKDRHRIRLFMYISFLMAFRTIPDRKLDDSATIKRIMKDVPSLILENLYERFTEIPEGGDKKRYRIWPKDLN
jgi:DNA-directed RNA polymerase I subunit RPA49